MRSDVSSELCSIEMDEDDNFQATAFMESVISDFGCFDNRFQGSHFCFKPQKEDIANFIELVMMAGKL